MTAKARYSKKMFQNLDSAEVRKLIIIGMKLAPSKAYELTQSQLYDWVYNRATEVPEEETIIGAQDISTKPFTEVDLDSVGEEAFRDGVMPYITELQEFIRGNTPKPPAWPPSEHHDSDESAIYDSSDEEPTTESASTGSNAAIDKDPKVTATATEKSETTATNQEVVKRRRGRPRKVDVAGMAAEKAKAKAASAPTKPKPKIKKVSLGAKASDVTIVQEPTSQTVSMDDLAKVMESLTVLSDRVSELSDAFLNNATNDVSRHTAVESELTSIKGQVSASRTEQASTNTLVSNALLFLLNSVVYSEGEEVSDLSQVLEPTAYLD